jgi:hypothetical protein
LLKRNAKISRRQNQKKIKPLEKGIGIDGEGGIKLGGVYLKLGEAVLLLREAVRSHQ